MYWSTSNTTQTAQTYKPKNHQQQSNLDMNFSYFPWPWRATNEEPSLRFDAKPQGVGKCRLESTRMKL
jgi:glucan biosynthesis protein